MGSDFHLRSWPLQEEAAEVSHIASAALTADALRVWSAADCGLSSVLYSVAVDALPALAKDLVII